MGAFTYKLIRAIGYPFMAVSSKAVMLHGDRIARDGAFIIAPNHSSPYDIACLMRAARRNLDFLSIVEFYEHPWVARLFRAMNCIFLNRSKTDASAARQILERLGAGRVVVMFPEGQIRREEQSVLVGKPFQPGVVRIAQVANAPIVPCVILDTAKYWRVLAWAPVRRTRYGVAFGEPICVPSGDDAERHRKHAMEQLHQAYLDLYQELCVALNRPKVTDRTLHVRQADGAMAECQSENCNPT